MDTGAAGLLGAAIGASAAIGGNLMLEAYKRRRDRQGVASALAGEIATILYMAERRKYVEHFTNVVLPQLEQGIDVKIPHFTPERDYRDPVIDRCLDKLPLLPGHLAERIVRFYSMLSGIRADLYRMAEGEGDVAWKAAIIREDLDLWKDTVSVGNEIVTELRREAKH
jgi:hypothetical protein